MMNELTTDLVFTAEVQSEFEDGWVPTLDSKFKFNHVKTDGKLVKILDYSFYKKTMSSQYTILKSSALTDQIKKSTLTQEVI